MIRDEARQSVRGEVYRISAAMLASFDVLEGYPDEYCRESIAVALDKGPIIPAWVYFYPRPVGQLLIDGEYLINLIG